MVLPVVDAASADASPVVGASPRDLVTAGVVALDVDGSAPAASSSGSTTCMLVRRM